MIRNFFCNISHKCFPRQNNHHHQHISPTDNLAANQQGLSNTASDNNQLPRYLTDLNRLACFVSQRTNQLKWVGVRLISTVMISKIFIANNPKYMNELFDFDIKVGKC